MFTPKGFFSEIQCPYLDTCVLPGCIFAHTKTVTDTTGDTASNRTGIQIDGGGSRDGEAGSPKRQKIEGENLRMSRTSTSTSTSTSTNLLKDAELYDPALACLSDSSLQVEENPKRQLLSLTRPVSPPPPKLKAYNEITIPIEQPAQELQISVSSKLKPATSSTFTSTRPVAEKKVPLQTPVKTPLKKEGLNPRALQVPAPAAHNIRFALVKALYDQIQRLNSELAKEAKNAHDAKGKLVLSDQALISRALDLEEDAALQPSIYSNMVKNKIMAYKRMTVKQWKEERETDLAKAKGLEAAWLSDTPNSKTEPPKPIQTGLTTEEELILLPRLYTSISNLSAYGYVISVPTDQEIETAKQGIEAAKGWEVCDRCKSRFQVFPGRREEDGALASGTQCTYHFGKALWAPRSATDPKSKREKKYFCCGETVGDSPGCTHSGNHVFKITEVKRLAAVLNFEETPENPSKKDANPVCIDGEMGYTVHGLELIRLTATSWPSGDALFDVLVRPIGEVLDLNTRYSGVHASDITSALPYSSSDKPPTTAGKDSNAKQELRIVSSPAAARAVLFSHLSPTTPLIGHGLENDLNATRIIHPIIIDTALLFPHRAGLPYRNGLKMLMESVLGRHIQVVINGKMEGHDSKEDANAAGDLVRFMVKEEWAKMRREGWVVEFGVFRPPGAEKSAKRGWRSGRDEGSVYEKRKKI